MKSSTSKSMYLKPRRCTSFTSIISTLLIGICLLCAWSFSLPSSKARYFSPNLDGSKDSISIPLSIEDEFLDKWKVFIYTKEGDSYQLIRLYTSINSKEILRMTGKKFFSRIFEKKQPIVIPEVINWDGYTRIPKDKKQTTFQSQKVKDGTYYYRIIAIDEAGNTSSSPLVPIVVDTVTPQAKLNLPSSIFSPNGDGNKEEFLFDFKLKNFQMSSDLLSIRILVNNDDVVFETSFSGLDNLTQKRFAWNGQYKGKDVPEGRYKAVFTTEDFAGNKKIYQENFIQLVRTIETVNLDTPSSAFAPNNNGYHDLITFNLSTSSPKGLEKWALRINPKGNDATVYTFSGEKDLPKLLIYEGQNEEDNVVPDGTYEALLNLRYSSGNKPSSKAIEFVVDTTPPVLDLTIKNKDYVFLPKAKNNNKLIVEQSSKGKGDESYFGVITDENGDQIKYQNFKSTVPSEFNWDGKNDLGEIVTGSFTYTLFGEDPLGNKSEITSQPFKVIDELASVSIKASSSAFSPNLDDIKEKVKITISMKDQNKARVQNQNLQIKLGKKIIKEIKATKFQKAYVWDGTDNSGNTVPDGKYTVKLKANLTGGESVESSPISIFVDTVPIKVTLDRNHDTFSPNGDGRKDSITISQIKEASSLGNNKDRITLFLRDQKGVIHRKHLWTGELPKKIKWNGTDQTKSQAPEGVYTYILKTVDHAGNKKLYKTKPFKLVRTLEEIELNMDRTIYSHSTRKPVSITPTFSSVLDFNRYSLESVSADGSKEILSIKTNAEGIAFKGKNEQGERLKDGVYYFYIQAFYDNGNQPVSPSVEFQIDSMGPTADIVSQPKYFSPDGDGIDDELSLKVKVQDESKIKNSTLSIFRLREFDKKSKPFDQSYKNYKQHEKPIREWRLGERASSLIKWDGRNKEGKLAIESANDYQIFVRSSDIAGNVHVSQKTFTADILVEKIDEDRYRIIINSINFKYGSDKMIGNYRRSLNRLSQILNKFNQYQFNITGHTDTKGSAEYNQKLSLKRAKAVYNYLVNKDMDPGRMTLEGRGESEPLIAPEVNEEQRRKNRRVEFYLIKNKK